MLMYEFVRDCMILGVFIEFYGVKIVVGRWILFWFKSGRWITIYPLEIIMDR